jgi:Squalene-hopene cyclase C-terminal domain
MSSIRTRVAGIGVLAAVLVGGLILPSTASAATTTDPVQAGAGWLSTQFEDGTHLPAPAGDHFDSYFSPSYFANYGENADVVFGLAAAKAGATKSGVALDYLATNIDNYADLSAAFGGPFDGSVAKAALAAIVGGRSATNFGGHNLLQTLKDDECAPVSPATTCAVAGPPASTVPAGSPAGIFSGISASFVILAEARAGGAYAPSADAVSYFLSLQCSDGGFTGDVTACGAGASDIDSTSYAVMALQALGGHSPELTNAVNWLIAQRNSDGSWNSANVNSTGLAAAALSGQGVDTSLSKTWLLSQQVPAGSAGAGALKFAGAFAPTALTVGTSPSVLATAQALTGLVTCGSLATLTAAGSTAGVSLFAASAAAGSTSVAQGATQTVTGTGFAGGEQVSATLNGAAAGTATADASGSVSFSITVPATVAVGSAAVTVTGPSSGLIATTAAFAVVAPAATSAVDATTITADAPELANTGTNGAALRDLTLVAGFALLAGTGLVAGGVIGNRRRRVG